jgi:hypothetical protein
VAGRLHDPTEENGLTTRSSAYGHGIQQFLIDRRIRQTRLASGTNRIPAPERARFKDSRSASESAARADHAQRSQDVASASTCRAAQLSGSHATRAIRITGSVGIGMLEASPQPASAFQEPSVGVPRLANSSSWAICSLGPCGRFDLNSSEEKRITQATRA